MSSCLGWCAVILALTGAALGTPVTSGDPKAFALVELFTSEGCSSCPPADDLLARLLGDAKRSERAVYGLAYHVDYWDTLGWKDPYSDHAFTRRQQTYEDFLYVRGPYTPQMVVNGTDQFVGSDRARAERSIDAALSRVPTVRVDVTARVKGHAIVVNWKTSAPSGSELHVAWAEAEAESTPDRGENAERKLRHVRVVRAFRTVPLESTFEGSLELTPATLRPGSVVAFVQDAKTGQILGASQADVEKGSVPF
jgi:hypothetical protein